jgi:G:T-mismatch repair DNA endonuclease (very short patch repair protein)
MSPVQGKTEKTHQRLPFVPVERRVQALSFLSAARVAFRQKQKRKITSPNALMKTQKYPLFIHGT